MSDVIVIGAGVNGLVAATFLAKAGLKTIVLERSERAGGSATTSELAPGFRVPTLEHAITIDPAIVRSLALERRGVDIVRPDAHAVAPADGRALVLWADAARAAREIATYSAHDAERYPRFLNSFARLSGVLRAINAAAAPSIDDPTAADVLELLKTGRRFRALGRADAYRLIRWMPMPVADLVAEWFDSEPLRATVAAGGVLGAFLGPWSAGSGALLMLLGAAEGHPVGTGWFVRGGIGRVADALLAAAREAGVEVRTGADVDAISLDEHGATGVRLRSGEELRARAVVSSADPKRTLVGLVDPMQRGPEFTRRVVNIRMHGTLAKVNFAVSRPPRFSALATRDAAEQTAALSGRIRLGSDIDAIERAFDAAKYGRVADTPWMELTIPSLTDPGLAPAGQHVVSAYVQYAPYCLRGTNWDAERDRLGDIAARTIAAHAPGFESTIVARQVITPLDLERTYGLTGGHIFHGELSLDQFFLMRPLLGWARYRTPIANLFLCGAGTHPGPASNGRSGALAAKEIVRALNR